MSPPLLDAGDLVGWTVLALQEPMAGSLSHCTESSGMLGTHPESQASLGIGIFGELGCSGSACRSLRIMPTSPPRGEPLNQGPPKEA